MPISRRPLLLLPLALAACGRNEAPLKIGFMGGLSGRVADLGEAGRNGVLLAVEERNAGGGIGGRRVELVIIDDQQDAERARQGIAALREAGVVALLGPLTSSMGEAVLPLLNDKGPLAISPTITATTLYGLDDQLLLLAPPVSENCARSAAYLQAQGLRRAAVAYDLGNRAYTEDWLRHFERSFGALGGQVVERAAFQSGTGYTDVIARMLAAKPDLLMFAANAVDTVRLTQAARNQGAQQAISAASWAATESLLQLGGRTVEGLSLPQYFDRDDRSARYLAFAAAYRQRFQQEPGFASVAAHDAAKALLDTLAEAGAAELKAALLSGRRIEGLQAGFSFNRFGDAQRSTHMTVVRDGHFVRLP